MCGGGGGSEELSQLDPDVGAEVQKFYSDMPMQEDFVENFGRMNGFTRPDVDAYNNALADYQSQQVNATGNPYAGIRTTVGSDRKRGADSMYAQLIRAQTRDYQNRFAPIERDLASRITSTGTTSISSDLNRTRGAIRTAQSSAMGQENRMLGRYGVTPQPNNRPNNQLVSSLVGGVNDTYLRDKDRRDRLLSGGLQNIGVAARQRSQIGG